METQNEKGTGEPEYYLFDDVEITDSLINYSSIKSELIIDSAIQKNDKSIGQLINGAEKKLEKYIIQLGAFSSKERADSFVKDNKDKISFPMSIIYKQQSNLYVVQIPPFKERTEAELVRNALWKVISFKDAFIITE
ncbi:MAG: SPOR domain-containing protein [Bacteroidota bacterium]